MAKNRLIENNEVIAEHDLHPMFDNSHDFRVVKHFPSSYKIWNIGRRNFDFEGYIPLCSCTSDGSCVNVETLQALKVPSEELAIALMNMSVRGTQVTGSNYKEILKELVEEIHKDDFKDLLFNEVDK